MTGIKELRQRLGMSRGELAVALGVHPNAIGNWERREGKPRMNIAWRLIRLCRAARVGASLERIYPEADYLGDAKD